MMRLGMVVNVNCQTRRRKSDGDGISYGFAAYANIRLLWKQMGAYL